jgi:hypothetical protein
MKTGFSTALSFFKSPHCAQCMSSITSLLPGFLVGGEASFGSMRSHSCTAFCTSSSDQTAFPPRASSSGPRWGRHSKCMSLFISAVTQEVCSLALSCLFLCIICTHHPEVGLKFQPPVEYRHCTRQAIHSVFESV